MTPPEILFGIQTMPAGHSKAGYHAAAGAMFEIKLKGNLDD
jgi:hypothetical protein